MKAVYYNKYGSPGVLEIRDLPRPVPHDHEVLVKVKAASINSWDWDLIRGWPLIIRMWGLFKPKYRIPGADIAGVIEAIGSKVNGFKPGDEVLSDLAENHFGAFAEYTCVNEKALALKSPKMSFEEAAAIPQAGIMAFQSLYDQIDIKPGQEVLMIGAGGGVGTFLIQMAKHLGAVVTATDIASKLDRLTALGADHVINYLIEDITKSDKRYDLIVDVKARYSIFTYRKLLKPGGTFAMVGGSGGAIIQTILLGPIISLFGKKVGIMGYKANKGYETIHELYENDKLKPIVDKTFPLSQARAAFQYYIENNFVGKVVLTMK